MILLLTVIVNSCSVDIKSVPNVSSSVSSALLVSEKRLPVVCSSALSEVLSESKKEIIAL